jgi:hypothetical protein
MPKEFHQLSLDQFVELLGTFPFERRIESVHMHHTWRPNHSQYKGLTTIVSMWEFHTQTKGWSDIAQHISIAPDGTIWTGRSWNQAPASATGFNGNSSAGPFMFETIGDFDLGKDLLEGAQKTTVLGVIAHVQEHFGLQPETLRFHNMMSEKSCPGSAIDYETILREVAEVRRQIANRPAAKRDGPAPFEDRVRPIRRMIDELRTVAPARRGIEENEGCDHSPGQEAEFERTTALPPETSRAARGDKLPPELIQRLRPHVINLNLGRLSSTGEFQNTEADVDAIFEEHLFNWAKARDGKALPIVFYAHGGLTSEQSGLLTADQQVKWWLENEAYPIHFVWETGLFETLGQLLNPSRRRAIDFAGPTDFALETLARAIGGVKVWAGMKVSAERAADNNGGARYAARKLKEFCERPEIKGRVELHAIGHSAGSIFHAHFIPAALEEKNPSFRSLHFLAPAIRVDTFERQLLGRIGQGNGIDSLSLFTMARDFELDDNCVSVYRKSLLYLIYYALEPERKTPILGLEESIRSDPNLKRLFNLDNKGSGPGEIIWSVTRQGVLPPAASTSRHHGDFNDDAATMESVGQRILRRKVTPFAAGGQRGLGIVEGIQAREPSLRSLFQQGDGPGASIPAAGPLPPSESRGPASGAGRRRALCVGIDSYPTCPLGGCVNDARQWRRTFQALGFEEPKLLSDSEATRSAILGELSALLSSSRAGDVVAFQFAGHGTQLPDLNGDEAGGDSPGEDEAMCPVDFDQGHFVIDDDLAAVFDKIPDGVSVTVFADCCHSGSNTRLAIGPPPVQGIGRDVRKRFLPATEAMKNAHAAFREALGGTRGAPSGRGAYDKAREVLFAACKSREVALESDGHGHFTTNATRILSSGTQGLTNAQFQARVVQAFGENSGQNPELHCATALRSHSLLGSIDRPAAGRTETQSPAPAAPGCEWRGEVARALEQVAQSIRG